jgi:hypothetical protein
MIVFGQPGMTDATDDLKKAYDPTKRSHSKSFRKKNQHHGNHDEDILRTVRTILKFGTMSLFSGEQVHVLRNASGPRLSGPRPESESASAGRPRSESARGPEHGPDGHRRDSAQCLE